MEKVCKKCGITKDSSCFYKRKQLKSGISSWCTQCENDAHKERQKWKRSDLNPDKAAYEESLKTTKRKYYLANKESIGKKRHTYSRTIKGKYTAYKTSAKGRGLSWDLTLEDFSIFWNRPCFYCNNAIEFIGLDRVDSSKGYHTGNVVSCCSVCNAMKSDLGMLEFISHIQKVILHLDCLAKPEGLVRIGKVLDAFNLQGYRNET